MRVERLGQIAYEDALRLQQTLAEARVSGGEDTLLLLTHPHTYTLGSAADESHILLNADELAARGIAVYRTDRGGGVTYHGAGQIVGYPIMQLERPNERGELRADVVGYVRRIESVLIATAADYGIKAYPIPGLTGVWAKTPAGDAKIAAIGVRVNVKRVTTHGFALNVNTDLRYFDGIVPCGIRDKGVTSLAALLARPVDEDEITARLIAHFGAVFGVEMVES